MITKDELLNEFLAIHPDSNHSCDMLRFVRYAVACAKNDEAINEAKLEESLSAERVDELLSAYSWIKMTTDYLSKS
jgi:hypothetical protein